jgi:hypothetical protein
MSEESLINIAQVRQKLKQVMYRHLKKRLKALFKRKPSSCLFNESVDLSDGSSICLCHFREVPEAPPRQVLCDGRHRGSVRFAQEDCPWWEPGRTKEVVKAEFQKLMRSEDRGLIAAEYPDIAALLWVLGGTNLEEDIAEVTSNSCEGTEEE